MVTLPLTTAISQSPSGLVNSPHPGTFLRELKHNPEQQAASAYMNALTLPGAEDMLAANDYQHMWESLGAGWGGDGEPASVPASSHGPVVVTLEPGGGERWLPGAD